MPSIKWLSSFLIVAPTLKQNLWWSSQLSLVMFTACLVDLTTGFAYTWSVPSWLLGKKFAQKENANTYYQSFKYFWEKLFK